MSKILAAGSRPVSNVSQTAQPSRAEIKLARAAVAEWTGDEGGLIVSGNFDKMDLSKLAPVVRTRVSKALDQVKADARTRDGGAYLVTAADESVDKRPFIVVDAVGGPKNANGVFLHSNEQFQVLDAKTGQRILGGQFLDQKLRWHP